MRLNSVSFVDRTVLDVTYALLVFLAGHSCSAILTFGTSPRCYAGENAGLEPANSLCSKTKTLCYAGSEDIYFYICLLPA